MKFLVVGFHGSGKREIAHILRKQDISVGRIFTNLEERSDTIYNSEEFEIFDTQTVNEIFENNSYMFIKEMGAVDGLTSYKTFEGLSTWEYDQNQVHVLSPDQFLAIPITKLIGEEICYVWVDNTRDARLTYYLSQESKYSFKDREELENADMDMFVKKMYSTAEGRVIYFMNEAPERISAIIYACIKHPDLLNIFTKYYN